uniref:ADDobody n=1 Tax=Human adenovirus sp. TaxID=1907210 RepID=UPI002AE0B37F|nr:Chain A, ADDobody [Human adenovirus sp.]8COI_B Chain B, ADDobody [Human adenovirus sp.]8COI_C Chain C, ADDobody [Human adenovirus sp.]8COI_D Chain D, ADDobody [Human adenovirus sp.]8COI_E Chain E, ADDobody [Human adenovirus sp.]8COI_F Chain F, ADDobody [Human adenovirus sp.]8COI_G Chain G, ADDobody [Human adenovirus sp.]8COI_H Chain H, ADDobody [Human adenovirus sp.]8COI_I Chain I, ADDobody [Human adenovirus sp.]8COI_J Chain J, ADDobody [Human adenovirus sp.]8COI_K Chain K, ADDobody [H
GAMGSGIQPNVNEYMFSNKFKARVMVSRKAPEGVTVNDTYDHKEDILKYEWFEFILPEGNFSATMTIDLMNNAIIDNYLEIGRQNGVLESDIGVKFDTRNFRLGWDPETKLIMPGVYTYEAFHPDIVLLPGCGVDFTESRLSNLLGIRKRHPFQEGFKIMYEDLEGGNIPALLDVTAYEESKKDTTTETTTKKELKIQPLEKDSKSRSYNVLEDKINTAYRSWYLSYNYGNPEKGIRSWTLLTTSDVTCGANGDSGNPVFSKSFYNEQAVYSQQLRQATSLTHVFNRFPENQILIRPPAPTITTVSENVP